MLRYLAVLAGLVLAAIAVWHPAPHPPQAVFTASEPAVAPAARRSRGRRGALGAQAAIVYVVGAVARPGLYRIGPRSRIDDAVREAGGMRADADAAGVNLAAHPADGDEIEVPRLGETLRRSSQRHRARGRARSRASKKHPPEGRIDLNASDADALATVPGIGTAIATRIVEVREREGAYDSFDELLDVAGMSPSRLAKATPYLRI